MKQMVKKVHYKISQDLFIRDKKHHESGVFYLPKIRLDDKCSLFVQNDNKLIGGIRENKWKFKSKYSKFES